MHFSMLLPISVNEDFFQNERPQTPNTCVTVTEWLWAWLWAWAGLLLGGE